MPHELPEQLVSQWQVHSKLPLQDDVEVAAAELLLLEHSPQEPNSRPPAVSPLAAVSLLQRDSSQPKLSLCPQGALWPQGSLP